MKEKQEIAGDHVQIEFFCMLYLGFTPRQVADMLVPDKDDGSLILHHMTELRAATGWLAAWDHAAGEGVNIGPRYDGSEHCPAPPEPDPLQ